MEMGHITSLTTSGTVGSRFVTQDELDDAKKAKEYEWKAAYERLGQEPPPMPEEQDYDPRSLFEKLSTQKDIKREEWDDKMRMANQWRGLEADEIAFLRDSADEQKEKERDIKRQEMEELQAFKMRQVQQNALSGPSTSAAPSPPMNKPAAKPAGQPKKGVKSLLKGVVVKKKDPAVKPQTPATPPVVPNVKPVKSEPTEPPTSTFTSSPSKATVKSEPKPDLKPLPVRIGFAAANEAPKRKRIGLANDYGDSSSDESDIETKGNQKKVKTET